MIRLMLNCCNCLIVCAFSNNRIVVTANKLLLAKDSLFLSDLCHSLHVATRSLIGGCCVVVASVTAGIIVNVFHHCSTITPLFYRPNPNPPSTRQTHLHIHPPPQHLPISKRLVKKFFRLLLINNHLYRLFLFTKKVTNNN